MKSSLEWNLEMSLVCHRIIESVRSRHSGFIAKRRYLEESQKQIITNKIKMINTIARRFFSISMGHDKEVKHIIKNAWRTVCQAFFIIMINVKLPYSWIYIQKIL